jgi:hypothetical protein
MRICPQKGLDAQDYKCVACHADIGLAGDEALLDGTSAPADWCTSWRTKCNSMLPCRRCYVKTHRLVLAVCGPSQTTWGCISAESAWLGSGTSCPRGCCTTGT